jgi:hypothetical protein
MPEVNTPPLPSQPDFISTTTYKSLLDPPEGDVFLKGLGHEMNEYLFWETY